MAIAREMRAGEEGSYEDQHVVVAYAYAGVDAPYSTVSRKAGGVVVERPSAASKNRQVKCTHGVLFEDHLEAEKQSLIESDWIARGRRERANKKAFRINYASYGRIQLLLPEVVR